MGAAAGRPPACGALTGQARLRLAERPSGLPGPGTFRVVQEEIEAPGPGQVLVEVAYLSVDPGLRGWIAEGGSYVEAVPVGGVMRALGVGRVVETTAGGPPVGSVVTGLLGVQEHAVVDADRLTVVEPAGAPLPRLLGALGTSGIAAYLGLVEVARPAAGSTVLVSGAAGSVGSVVGQIARILGCRVIGIAGGPEKCAWIVDELGFDAAIDHRADDVGARLAALAPDGVDVYFDNVGGPMLDVVLTRIAIGAVVVLSGTMAQWELGSWPGLQQHRQLLVRRARMEGFLVFDHTDRYDDARRVLAGWLDGGALIAREDVVPGGVAAFPDAFTGLFRGDNIGKRVVAVHGG